MGVLSFYFSSETCIRKIKHNSSLPSVPMCQKRFKISPNCPNIITKHAGIMFLGGESQDASLWLPLNSIKQHCPQNYLWFGPGGLQKTLLMTILNCQNMSINSAWPREVLSPTACTTRTPFVLTFVDRCRVAALSAKLKPAEHDFWTQKRRGGRSGGNASPCRLFLPEAAELWTKLG